MHPCPINHVCWLLPAHMWALLRSLALAERPASPRSLCLPLEGGCPRGNYYLMEGICDPAHFPLAGGEGWWRGTTSEWQFTFWSCLWDQTEVKTFRTTSLIFFPLAYPASLISLQFSLESSPSINHGHRNLSQCLFTGNLT